MFWQGFNAVLLEPVREERLRHREDRAEKADLGAFEFSYFADSGIHNAHPRDGKVIVAAEVLIYPVNRITGRHHKSSTRGSQSLNCRDYRWSVTVAGVDELLEIKAMNYQLRVGIVLIFQIIPLC